MPARLRKCRFAWHENEIRKDLTPSERVAIGRAIEAQIKAAIGERRGRPAREPVNRSTLPLEPETQPATEKPPELAGLSGRETRDLAAERAGFGGRETYRQAAKVVDKGAPELVQAMDAGKVSTSAEDPLGFVIAKNLKRRHLTESQRAMVAERLASMKQGARTDLAEISAMSQAHAATMLNVSVDSVQFAKKVRRKGSPTLVSAVESGEVSVSTAAEVATLPPAEQSEIAAKGAALGVEADGAPSLASCFCGLFHKRNVGNICRRFSAPRATPLGNGPAFRMQLLIYRLAPRGQRGVAGG